ncbi:hypothetical protein F2P81_017402 [Scophthalmus maximus]|uniref:Uncharacterized protein n=1 Tax=Scophthalmus maximus TaxID=52904 RepID=A0A6A4SHN8_SCOMX|nr:hypothetical protein F2P81_017402 [Scophthalmus maximus]
MSLDVFSRYVRGRRRGADDRTLTFCAKVRYTSGRCQLPLKNEEEEEEENKKKKEEETGIQICCTITHVVISHRNHSAQPHHIPRPAFLDSFTIESLF